MAMNRTGKHPPKQAIAIVLVAVMTAGCASTDTKSCTEYETEVTIKGVDGKKKLKGFACPDKEEKDVWRASEDLPFWEILKLVWKVW